MHLKKNITSNSILAITIGLVYLWFGTLKFFPNASPAEDLAKNTMDVLTFSLVPSAVSIILLAIWETVLGVMLLLNIYRRKVILCALAHIAFTFTPLFLFPDQSFTDAPFSFTLLGQYIFKNVIIIGALVALYRLPVKHFAPGEN